MPKEPGESQGEQESLENLSEEELAHKIDELDAKELDFLMKNKEITDADRELADIEYGGMDMDPKKYAEVKKLTPEEGRRVVELRKIISKACEPLMAIDEEKDKYLTEHEKKIGRNYYAHIEAVDRTMEE